MKNILSVWLAFFFVLPLAAQIKPVVPYPSELTVAADGKGDYTSIQQAINAVRAYSPIPVTIHIKNGVYREKVVIPAWVTNITIEGESSENTILTYDDYSGKPLPGVTDTANKKNRFTTFTTYTVWIQGNDVVLKNLTVRNTAGRVGQAVALHVDGDRVVIKDCNLLGNQDTLLTANGSSRQYYVNCFIEGTTDFIFGNATAVFERCTIKALTNSFITAASTTPLQKFGYVFLDCTLVADPAATKVYLGRPWRTNASVTSLIPILAPIFYRRAGTTGAAPKMKKPPGMQNTSRQVPVPIPPDGQNGANN